MNSKEKETFDQTCDNWIEAKSLRPAVTVSTEEMKERLDRYLSKAGQDKIDSLRARAAVTDAHLVEEGEIISDGEDEVDENNGFVEDDE